MVFPSGLKRVTLVGSRLVVWYYINLEHLLIAANVYKVKVAIICITLLIISRYSNAHEYIFQLHFVEKKHTTKRTVQYVIFRYIFL